MTTTELYQQSTVLGSNPAQLMSMMLGMLAGDLRRAIGAVREGDRERRTNELVHAQAVLEQMQLSLDLRNGGEFALNLERLFYSVRSKLIEAQWKESREILEEQLAAVETVRSVWDECLAEVATQESNTPPAYFAAEQLAGTATAEWHA